MKSKLARIFVALGIAALVAGVAPQIVSAAPAPKATASIDVHEVLAGAPQAFVVTVNQPVSALLTPATSVSIIAPFSQFKILSVTDPDGWTSKVSASGDRVVFKNPTGIRGGSSQSFAIATTTKRPNTDISDTWSVATAIGAEPVPQYTPADPSAAGALGTFVRTLEVGAITVTSPAQLLGESPLTVTAGQTGVGVNVEFINDGGAPQTVTASLASTNATPSASQDFTIPANSATTRSFTVGFATATGPGELTADVSNASSDAVDESLEFTIQSPLDGAFVAGTLTPTDVAPAASFTFALSVDPSGDVVGTVDTATSVLRLAADNIAAALTGPATIDGAGPDTPLTFATTLVPPATPDNDYTDGVLHLTGTDSNGAPFSRDIPVAQNLNVDSQIPIVTPTVSVPATKVPGTTSAATDGTTLTFGGTITDGPTKPCGSCTIVAAVVEALSATDAVLGTTDVKSALSLSSGGVISGSQAIATWPAGTTKAHLVVDVTDVTNKASRSSSVPKTEVDLFPPHLASARTGGPDANAPDFRRIDVTFSEPVVLLSPVGNEIGFAPSDWTCAGFTVTAATMAGNHRSAQLTLDKDLGRDQKPTCQYGPTGPRLQDRVAKSLLNESVTALDGIIPGTPTITEVEGQAPYGATFYTNDSTPDVIIENVDVDYDVKVYEDVNDDDAITGVDLLVGSGTASGPTIVLTLDDFGGTDDPDIDLITVAKDATGNAGPLGFFPLVLDFTSPTIASAGVTSSPGDPQVVLTFGPTEVLVGPAAADDWGLFDGTGQRYQIGEVAISANTVTLTVGDARFNATTDLTVVRYELFDTGAGTQLSDRAGNLLGEGQRSF